MKRLLGMKQENLKKNYMDCVRVYCSDQSEENRKNLQVASYQFDEAFTEEADILQIRELNQAATVSVHRTLDDVEQTLYEEGMGDKLKQLKEVIGMMVKKISVLIAKPTPSDNVGIVWFKLAGNHVELAMAIRDLRAEGPSVAEMLETGDDAYDIAASIKSIRGEVQQEPF